MNAFPNVSAVHSRRTGQNPIFDEIFTSSQISQLDDIRFRIMNLEKRPPWGGYSFNPSVIRVADYKAIGPFSKFRHEPDISEEYARRDMAFACLEKPACETTGRGRHVHDPYVPQDGRKDFRQTLEACKRSFLKVIGRLSVPRR